MTCDGGSDERKAASQLVKEGNDLWCAGHNAQLCVGDALDPKKKSAPPECAKLRNVIQKAHDLVVLINGHRDMFSAFATLAADKKASTHGARMWETLVIDNDTRWDTDLMLLERVIYFDNEILDLFANEKLRFPRECVLEREEFDLAFAMVQVLNPIRKFTKFVQQREAITLAYLPQKVDDLVSDLAPGVFAHQLRGRAPDVLSIIENLQALLVKSIKVRFGSLSPRAPSRWPPPFFSPVPARLSSRTSSSTMELD